MNTKNWEVIEQDFKELFYEGERNSTYCKKHKTLATPHEIKEFARYETEKALSDQLQRIKEEIEAKRMKFVPGAAESIEFEDPTAVEGHNIALDKALQIINQSDESK